MAALARVPAPMTSRRGPNGQEVQRLVPFQARHAPLQPFPAPAFPLIVSFLDSRSVPKSHLAMYGKNRQLVTDQPNEVVKLPI